MGSSARGLLRGCGMGVASGFFDGVACVSMGLAKRKFLIGVGRPGLRPWLYN